MPWNLLLFPLAAGYYILTRSFLFKFRQQRLDKQRVIFESVLLGTLIGGATYILSLFANKNFKETLLWVKDLIPLKIPYLLTAISTVILAIILTKTHNRFLDKQRYINNALKRHGNELELLLGRSVQKKELLLFTLTNKKSYVGWVKELPIPSVSNYVRIIPAISGFRDDEMGLIFTNQYLVYYSERIKDGEVIDIKDLNSDIIIDMDNIITVCYFDMKMYEEMNINNKKIKTA